MIVDRLPPLSDNAAVDAALRAELKAAFAPLALKLKNRTQPLLAKTARDVALEGLDAAERERLMAAQNNAELERMLLEQALKDQLGMMDDAKMPMAGAQPMGGGQRMGGGGGAGDGGGGRGGAAPAPGDRRMSDLSRALSKPEDKPAAKEEKKSSAASTPAKRFAEEKETPEAAAKAPTPPAAGDQPVAKGDPLGKKSPLAPIAPFGSAAPLSAGTNSPAASGAMPLASSPSSNGMGEFGYVNGSGYEAAPNVKFNYRREVGFGSSAGGDDSSSDGAYESEVTMPSGLPLISAASLGSTGAATSLGSSSSPAFSKAMQITLGGLCATKSLNCDRNAK